MLRICTRVGGRKVDVGATGVKVAWKTLVTAPWIVASGSAGRGASVSWQVCGGEGMVQKLSLIGL